MTKTNPDPAKSYLIKIWDGVTGNSKLPQGAQGKLGPMEIVITPSFIALFIGFMSLIERAPAKTLPAMAVAYMATALASIGTRWTNASVESTPSLKKIWDKVSGRKLYTLETGMIVGSIFQGVEALKAGASVASSTAYGVLTGSLMIGVPAMMAVALLSKRYKFFRADPNDDPEPEAPKPSI